jgi:TATA-binding protein-associated factor Taf7
MSDELERHLRVGRPALRKFMRRYRELEAEGRIDPATRRRLISVLNLLVKEAEDVRALLDTTIPDHLPDDE